MPLKRIFIAEGTKPDRTLDEIARRAAEAGITLERVAASACSTRRASAARTRASWPRPRRTRSRTLDAVLARAEGKRTRSSSRSTTSPTRATSARSSEPPRSSAPTGCSSPSAARPRSPPAAYKASAGALAHVLLAQEANLVRSLERCKKEAGYWVAGASEHAEQTAWDAPLDGRVVLVMGSEGEGLARLTRETLRLPRAAAAGGQGRLAQRRAGGDGARRTSGCGAARCEVVSRCAHADRRRLQRHPPDAAYKPLAEDDLDASRAGARLRRRGVRARRVPTRRSCSTATTTRAPTGSRTRLPASR